MENLEKYSQIKRRTRPDFINIHPIQAAGKLTEAAKKALIEFGDGYSVCDLCLEGKLQTIKNPPIKDFLDDLATFMGMETARPTAGSRMAMNIVFKVLAKPGDVVILDGNAHYTTYLAAEDNLVKLKEVPNSGYPDFIIYEDLFEEKIEMVKKETGKLPAFIVLTQVDYNYGNICNAKKVGEISKKFSIPFVINGAYSVGVMPVKGMDLLADILIASGHKSMAASGPIGILGTTDKLADKLFEKSSIIGDWSGRKFGNKECHLFGCPPVYGAPIATLMASFPTIVQRTKKEIWDEEVKKIRFFVQEIEKIEGIKQVGQRPHNHTLTKLETPSLHEASKNHKDKGYFLFKALKKKKIAGLFPGSTKSFKINTYGLTWEEIKKVINIFINIAEENDIKIN
ncbi:MAG: O-phospho-L-seryl-tRNA:Cys-tRNA synthase [Candidatus Lokiarchaeota archaeon]|nr:O-phospho-L-seryl-tRNA:Cys-tRNA synthase [Candidatus Lokiarchaeota archaeon]